MQVKTFLIFAAVAIAGASASSHEKRLADNFDTLTEPLTGSETTLDPATHKEVRPNANTNANANPNVNAKTQTAAKPQAKENMWKDIPNIQGPAGFSTGHTVYNTQGKRVYRKRRDINSYPTDIEKANDKFNSDFKNHHVAATVNYASDILHATESYTGDVEKLATRDAGDQATAYANAISDATQKYVEAVAAKPVSASAEYAEAITKAVAAYTASLAALR